MLSLSMFIIGAIIFTLYIIGLIFGALVLDMWSAETSPKALIGIGWTALLLIGLFYTEKNIILFKELASNNGININISDSPIQTIHIGDPNKVMDIHREALRSNIYIQPIRYPTVPINKELFMKKLA